jgi:hypothetical protein
MKRLMIMLGFLFFATTVYADSQNVFIQIRFSVDTPQGTFTDAIYYTQAEFAALPGGAIATEKARRVQAWRQAILNPPTPPTPSTDDLQRSIDEIDETREQFLLRRQALLAACRARGGCQ